MNISNCAGSKSILAMAFRSWDTRALLELEDVQRRLTEQIARQEVLLETSHAMQAHAEREHRAHLGLSRQQLMYLRAVRYLREHGIAPSWPRGSAPPQPHPTATNDV